ncbi:unnamed protein product [Adineta ricciae]|uniref:MRH domain-containing protein n=1 Tax=Adineta ricciae TaxID=249248 RepID=A0A814ZJA7_ADIRI|nr:unnamed protein product [Adineta ricciae]
MHVAFILIVYCTLAYGDCNFHADTQMQPIQEAMKKWKIYGTEMTVSNNEVTYSIGICKSPSNTTNYTAILQKGTNFSAVIGRLDSVNLVSGDGWIQLTYEKGDPYNNICDNVTRQASIMFICGTNMTTITIRQQHTYTDMHCNYMFQLQVPEMCPPAVIVEESKKLSGGAIFLIIVFSIAAAYLILGGIYMHVKRGARGLDRIPHLNMWRTFGGLAADGCDFCCRCDRPSPRAGYFLDESGPDFRGDDDILSP